jgi:transposase
MKKHSKTLSDTGKRKMIEQGMNVVAGLDIGDKHSHVCLIDLDGHIVESKKIRTSQPALEKYFAAWAAMRVVFEAGTHANWIYRLIQRLGHEPLMADTRRLALITQSLSKDDRTDAERLAELGLRMPEMLNPVTPCSVETQQDRAVLKARETLVRVRTTLINNVRGTLKSLGYRLPTCDADAFVRKAGPDVPDELRDTLQPLLLFIQRATDDVRRYDKRIEQLCKKYPATERLRSIRGVGPITALAFVLNLDNDVKRLTNSRDAGARMGLRPKRHESGARSPELSITKSGDRMLRRLLVQCAQYILGRHGEDSALKRWGLRLAARGGKSAKRKAVVAVARKLSVLLHVLWKRDTNFDPLYGISSSQAA